MEDAAGLIEGIRKQVHASGLPLNPARLTIEPVLNWGGFVNRSFRLSDDHSSYLLKIAVSPHAWAGLDRWRHFSELLAERYRAPRMVTWMDLATSGVGGPIFEWVQGAAPARIDELPVAAVTGLLHDLHRNDGLVAALAELGDIISPCAHAYHRSYHSRFMEDLETVGPAPPPFVDRHALDWMHTEAVNLQSAVHSSSAFSEPADCPVHGDLWINNTLLSGSDRWYVLDWDGLSLGDPAMDWAMLFGPSRGSPDGNIELAESLAMLNGAGRERLHVYARAALLDWIIDPLADWVQAEAEPFHGDPVRAGNERVYHQSLIAYRQRYRGG